MKHSHKKSFDWYSMQQRYSIRKYHFGAASVLLGTALVLGTAANAQAVQAEEHNPEATNSVSVDKVEEATKPAEVATPKKETTYAGAAQRMHITRRYPKDRFRSRSHNTTVRLYTRVQRSKRQALKSMKPNGAFFLKKYNTPRLPSTLERTTLRF